MSAGWKPNAVIIPSFLETHLYLSFAERCVSEGRADDAIQTYELLLDHNPSSIEGWLQLANLLIDHGRIDQAVSTLRSLTRAHPTYRQGQLTLNKLLHTRHRRPKALDAR